MPCIDFLLTNIGFTEIKTNKGSTFVSAMINETMKLPLEVFYEQEELKFGVLASHCETLECKMLKLSWEELQQAVSEQMDETAYIEPL